MSLSPRSSRFSFVAFCALVALVSGVLITTATTAPRLAIIDDVKEYFGIGTFHPYASATQVTELDLAPTPEPLAPLAATYTWNQTGTASWATAANWTPTRTTPTPDDILLFNNGATSTVTNVPPQAIGELAVSANTTVNLQANAAATLTLNNGATALSIASGSTLNVNGTNSLTIAIPTGSTGSISGNMSCANAGHLLTAGDASGITFNNGSKFTQDTGCTPASSGGAFGNSSVIASSIVFASGSEFIQKAGANPFQKTQPASVVVFQTGSTFRFQQNLAPSFSGRTYGNLEINSSTFNQTVTGANPVVIDNLTVTQGTLGFNMTSIGHAIKGNISVAAGATLKFAPIADGTINLNGTSAQTVGGAGTINISGGGGTPTFVVSNAFGVTLQRNLDLGTGTLNVNSGGLLNCGSFALSGTGGGAFTLNSAGTLGIGSSAGISSSGANGNITTPNLVFSTGANYVYNGSTNQATGNGLPTPVKSLTIANTGVAGSNTVTLGSNVTATGGVTVSSGVLGSNGGSTTAITGTVTVSSGATVAPGSSAGTLSTGNITFQTSSNLSVELGGTTAGTGYDQLVTSGTASLNGTLNVSFINSFVPSSGNTFTIISGARTGTFSSVVWPVGYTGTVTNNANSVVLSNIAMAPTVATNAASSVTATGATLNGTGNPNGATTTGRFRYSTINPATCNDTFGTRAPASAASDSVLGAGASGVAYSQAITGLLPATTYYFCAIANNNVGTSFGSVSNFTTPGIAPTVTTNPVNVTLNNDSTATFTAAASGSPTPTVQWEFSTNGGASYSNVSGATTTTLTIPNVLALQNGTKYRAVFTNANGSVTTTPATMTVYQRTSLTLSPVSATAGAPVNVTATLTTVTGGAGISGQTVTFSFGGVISSQTATTNALGVATVSGTFPNAGNFPATASFLNSAGFFSDHTGAIPVIAETSSATMTVAAAATSLAPLSVATTEFVDNSLTVSTTLTRTSAPAGAVPGATVVFTLTNPSVTQTFTGTTNVSGNASVSFPLTARGVYNVTASYSGSASLSAATSNTATVNVYQRTSLVLSPASGTAEAPVNVTATLTGFPGGGAIAGETVSFDFGGVIPLQSATTNASGVGTVSVIFPSAGSFPATASFLNAGGFFADHTGALIAESSTASITVNTPVETDVTVSGGNLTITDVNGATSADDITISCSAPNIIISDPGNSLNVSVPLASVTGSITVNTLGGNDKLILDLSGCNFIPAGGVAFNGGAQTSTPGDTLVITGGNQGTVTYNYTNTHDGSIVMSNFGTVNYTGLEPISNSGTATDVVFNLPAGPTAGTLADDGTAANGLSRLSGATFEQTDFSNPTSALTINRGNAADTMVVNALPDLTSSLTMGSAGGGEFSTITFNGAITLASGRSLAGFAASTISLPNTSSDLATSGAGTIALTTARDITFASGASATTVDGALTLNANQQGTATTGSFTGISVNAATVKITGNGTLTLNGRGGDSSLGLQDGIDIKNAGVVQGGTSGNTNVTGYGGGTSGTSSFDPGIFIQNSNSRITSGGANVSVTGTGGGSGIGGANIGVWLVDFAQITSGGAGTVSVQGIGGNLAGTGGTNTGVSVTDSGAITSGGGNVSVTGTEGGSNSEAIDLLRSAAITTATNGGTATLVGNSMNFESTVVVSAQAGSSVTLNQRTNGVAINLGAATDPNGGPLSLTDAELDIVSAGTLNIGNANSGAITVSNGIVLTDAPVIGTLNLVTSANLIDGFAGIDFEVSNLNITAPTGIPSVGGDGINIKADALTTDSSGSNGDQFINETGTVTVGANDLNAGSGTITFSAGGRYNTAPGGDILSNVIVGSAATLGGTGVVSSTKTTTVQSSGTIAPGTSPGILNTGNMSFASGSTFAVEIGGPTPGNTATNHDQLNVTGTVNLGGATLTLASFNGFVPTAGQQFVIVNNDGSEPIVGTFGGISEGATIAPFMGSSLQATVTYQGGTNNNDVVLTAVNPPAVITASTPGPFGFGTVTMGNVSASQNYTVSGVNLTANLVVTAPTHYQVSQSPNSGFGSSVTLVPSSGTVAITTIYVRFSPGATGPLGGSVTNASTGASTQTVSVIGSGSPAICTAPPANMVAWYSAEGDANDRFGVNNGTLQNGATTGAGKVGQAFTFDGIDDFVQVANSPVLNPTAAITLDAWVFVTGGQGLHRDIISKDGESFERQFLISASEVDRYRAHIGVSGGFINFDGSTPVQLNTWTHVAMTYDSSTLKLYVNGVLDGSQNVTGAIIATPQPLRIGGGAPVGQQQLFFPGRIDEAEIFDRALTLTELANIYNASTAGKCPTPDIKVEQPVGSDLTDGVSTVSFGSQAFGSPSAPKLFTVRNNGSSNLTINIAGITKDGTNLADYTIATTGMSPVIVPNGNTAFNVIFTPGGSGARVAAIHIPSDDPDENPFDINLTGNATPAATSLAPLTVAATSFVGNSVLVSTTLTRTTAPAGPLSGESVTFTLTDPSATPTSLTGTTDGSGNVSVLFPLATRGVHTVSATFGGNAALASATSNSPSVTVYQKTLISLSPVTATAGTPVSVSATLTAAPGGVPISGQTVNFSYGGVIAPQSATTNTSGVATVTATFTTTGNPSTTASFLNAAGFFADHTGAIPAIAETSSATVTVNPGPTATLSVVPSTFTATAGTVFNTTVTAKDSSGNTATGYTGTVQFSSSDGQAVLPGNYTFVSGDGGTHTFSTTLKTAGVRTIAATATVNAGIIGTTPGITVVAASPMQMTANAATTPQTTVVSTAFANALAVTVNDAFNNAISGVNVTFTAPGLGASGKFTNNTATITVATNGSGVASTPFTANATAGGPYTVTAVAAVPPSVNFSLANTAGAATQMTANAGTTPQSANLNTAFAVAPGVTVKDAFNNPVSGVSVTFTAPGSGASGTFSNSTATITVATNASGVASASLTTNGTPGTYNTTAAASGLTTVNFSLTNDCTTNPVVTNNNDSGAGSLSQAVSVACPGSTVTFAAPPFNAAQTIALTTGEILIEKDLTITGPGANLLTVSGNNTSRVFNITGGVIVTISGLTMRDATGGLGGAISGTYGVTLNLNDSVVRNSTGFGGAIGMAFCNLNMNRVTVLNNSGENVYMQDGAMVIQNSTFSGGSGVAIQLDAISGNSNLTMVNSTISGNIVLGGSSAIKSTAQQAGLTATTKLINSTITGNSTTPTGHAGAVWLPPGLGTNVLSMLNTIASGNTSGGVANDIDGTASLTSSFNLIGTGGGFTNGVNNNIVGVNNPLLALLANNGGPTQTHALITGSLAINAARDLTTINGAINNSAITIVVAESMGVLPGLPIQIDSEQMLVTAVSGNTLAVTRGANGTTAAAHANGAVVNPAFDQRGKGFRRKAGAAIDIGAFEFPDTRPVANNINPPAFNEDLQGVITLSYTDAESDVATACAVSTPTNVAVTTPCLCAAGVCNVGVTGTPFNYNGPASFGFNVTANGQTSNTATATLNITPVNDSPSFTKGPDQTVLEDAGAQTVTPWATAISPGPANELAQTVGFQVTGNTNTGLFSAGPATSPTGTLTYTPAADANGTATITINLKDSGGIANGGVDTSANQTFVINVTAVNDAPSFTKGPDQTVLVNAGAQAVNNWAMAISRGPANESTQTVAFHVTNNTNAGLFSAVPAISPTGTLTYTSAANTFGTATITINLKDNGNTASGGVDTSAPQSFVINVTPVADLAITKTDGVTSTPSGSPVVYNITATNLGPNGVTRATVTDTFPAAVTGVAWTCSGTGSGTCNPSGTGNINEQPVNIPVGGTVTFLASAVISPSATGNLTNTATVAVPAGTTDPNLANNTATDTDTLTAPSMFVIDDVTKAEDDTGTTPFVFTVTKQGGTGFATAVQFLTVEGTALAGSDYVAQSGTLNFGPLETAKTITVLVNGDTTIEGPETFTVHLLGNTRALIGDADGTGTIVNDDGATPTPTPIPTPTPTPNRFEGDINRTAVGVPGTGDGDVNVGDQLQYLRFLNGTDCPSANEQPRLDGGPRVLLGDGLLGSTDGAAIDAYARHDSATDFNPNTPAWDPTPSGGPTTITNLGCTPGPDLDAKTAAAAEPETSASARTLRLIPAQARRNTYVTVDIELNAQGNEAGTQFGLHFDPTVLAISDISGVNVNPDITLGAGIPAGATLNVNAEDAANGNIGIVENFNRDIAAITAIPLGGTRIARVRFRVLDGAEAGRSRVTFDDTVLSRFTADTTGRSLAATYDQEGSVTVAALPSVSVSGKVTTPDGRSIRNATVTIVDQTGFVRTVTTSAFGNYTFDGVTTGEQYTITVASRQYRFAPRTVQASDNLVDVDFVGLD